MQGYIDNIEKRTLENTNFREVLFTSQHLQEEIGIETHTTTDQFLRIEQGNGKAILNGEETTIQDGDVVIVPAGTEHNIINTSKENPLKIYTIYAPPHHKEGTVHTTKSDAEHDTGDHL